MKHPFRAALVLIFALGVSGCSTSNAPSPVARSAVAQPGPSNAEPTPASTPRSEPASTSAASPGAVGSAAVTKVLVFVVENHSLAQMKTEMRYTFELAQRFGYATSYTAIRHPSLPNHIAIAGGQTYGITNYDPPSAKPVGGTSVFGQAIAGGMTAALFADGMPENCTTRNGGSDYAVKHNPWAYFTGEATICHKYDVPVGALDGAITQGKLPNAGMVIPNRCNDAHDCPLGTADAWFKGWMTKIFNGPDWRSGHLTVILTADEDDRSADNNVLTVVIHPSQKANVVTSALTHYSLTRLYEEVTDVPFLFNAAAAPSMATAFGLPLRQ